MLMKYEALVGFSGAISMSKGEVGEIKDENLVADLTEAGYIKAVTTKPKKEKTSKKGE